MLAIIGAALMIIVAFTTGTALLATLVIRLVFFQLEMVSITVSADGRRVYYGDYQDDSSCV